MGIRAVLGGRPAGPCLGGLGGARHKLAGGNRFAGADLGVSGRRGSPVHLDDGVGPLTEAGLAGRLGGALGRVGGGARLLGKGGGVLSIDVLGRRFRLRGIVGRF